MIDREKVIKGLECCIDANGKNCPMACPFFQKCFPTFESTEPFYPIMRAALDLLKEQEAEQPIVHENSYGWKFYYCPKCKQEFYQNRKQAYCDKCGQAVK